ncbi:hypothetical protein ACS0TY_019964 [Phlomoides rotata]
METCFQFEREVWHLLVNLAEMWIIFSKRLYKFLFTKFIQWIWCLLVCLSLEVYASQVPDTVRTYVLSQVRLSCYKARDAFYVCLEKELNKKHTEIASVGLLAALPS